MPIYEYRRKTDGSVFEVVQKAGDPVLEVCPTTGVPVEKLISRSSFQLKGGGWYTTDYKNAGTAPSPVETLSSEATPAAASSGSEAASSETKGPEAPASSEKSGGCTKPGCGGSGHCSS
ncbi:MAG: FmdB family transcriptional regulator [Deltaproteobacteria bacterium CG11_big_fil_rev_8_21_14_0_20_45_16]|nr:MAG: FmdB family transcriptional regulator [Deltaproteobacteria bacterium CG11_big_fil_rev_8_21_14_0_20_45_16]